MVQSSGCGGKVPLAARELSPGDDVAKRKGGDGGMFRWWGAVLAFFSVALLLAALRSNSGANVKDLSDTVMTLTRQLQERVGESEHLQELEELRHKLSDRDIELSWERQHVAEEEEVQRLMHDAMAERIHQDHEAIKEVTETTSGYARRSAEALNALHKEKSDNAELKVALAFALEELAKARSQLPPVPEGESLKYGHEQAMRNLEAGKLRKKPNTSYQPGDNIEIIEYQEGGKVALRPGIVQAVNADGTFSLVKFELSLLVENQKRGAFQTYRVYGPMTSAWLEVAHDEYVPCTIVRFISTSARPGFELHGSYEVLRDGGSEIEEAPAMRMHRYAELGEVVGAGTINDLPEEGEEGGGEMQRHATTIEESPHQGHQQRILQAKQIEETRKAHSSGRSHTS
ncbi:hypothetical protein ACHAXT_005775 [Thalassiosira profunda]